MREIVLRTTVMNNTSGTLSLFLNTCFLSKNIQVKKNFDTSQENEKKDMFYI